MARAFKTGVDYFSVDADIFSDNKIQFVSARFGVLGELLIVKLLCKIYRNGYYIPWTTDDAILFTKTLGAEYTLSCVEGVIDELLKRDFLNSSLYKNYGILTSRGIQKRYFEAVKRYKYVEIDSNYILVDLSNRTNLFENGINVNINPENVCTGTQIKGNEMKQNETKENETKENETKKKEIKKKKTHLKVVVADATTTTLGDNFNSFILEPIHQSAINIPPMSPALNAVWEILIKQPRWRNKTPQSLQMTQKQLSEFDDEFAIRLVENAISNNYQGVVFPNTQTDYQKWLGSKRSSSGRRSALEEHILAEFNKL